MKKLIYLASILLAGAMVIVLSCSKESSVNNSQEMKKSGLSPRDLKINSLIMDFKKDLAYYRKHPDIKDGETKSVDSALWYMEATINFYHSFPEQYYSQYELDTSYIVVPKNTNGTVNMTDLSQKYYEMKDKVSDNYHDSQFSEKGLGFVDLSIDSQDANSVSFEVISATGEKGIDPGIGPFGEGDDYWYGEGKGHCEWDFEDDAAIQLASKMNEELSILNQSFAFVSISFIDKKGGDDNVRVPGDPMDNYYDYYLYSSRTNITPFNASHTLCLQPNEMNHYYQSLKYLILTKIPNEDLLPNHAVQTIFDVVGDKEQTGPNNEYTHFYHWFKFQCGEKIAIGSPEYRSEL